MQTRDTQCTCLKCGYEWHPLSDTILPKVCPRCKQYTWNQPRKRGFDKAAMIGKAKAATEEI